LTPQPGLPDLVFAGDGAFTVDGVAYGARRTHPQGVREAAVHEAFYRRLGGYRYVASSQVNRGEDFAYLPEAYGGMILAGYGFGTEAVAHVEAQEVLRRPVVSLRLVDQRLDRLGVALAALDDENIAYWPDAFSSASRQVLARLFPRAVLAGEPDGLNLVSDGHHVFISAHASDLVDRVAAAGYQPVPVDLSELRGGVRHCVAELRP
jgi:N-dimethylarginine dimethylaminohydrolase